ncbi:MAG TPA: sulfatase-like hydrolase/transferase [Terriglobales bacterium]|nr:sulfatase-like hydrolase/transferase [Terriglobales bacterium]
MKNSPTGLRKMIIFPMFVIRRWACLVWLTVWWTASGLAVPVPAPPMPSHPNVILITLDTTRADRMGFLGSKLGLTPNLDTLAHDSAVFTRAYAQAPLTTTSHASILTGTYPQYHQVNTFGMPLATDLPYAPAILRAHGYRTAAFVGSIILNPNPPYAPGFDRGFEIYDAGFHNEGPGEDRYHTVQRRGDEVVAHALAWLNKHPKGPFFMWVHLYDAHDPYEPPEPYKTRNASAPYDGAIAYEDAVVGKLIRQLKLRGLYDGTVMAVVADHGESLGAHGEDTHGIFLYDETIQVPLLIKMPIKLPIKLPRASGGGKRIENRVELVDILPTLLQEARIEIPKEVQGESLLALMEMRAGGVEGNPTVEAWRDRAAYAQTEYPRSEFGWSPERSLRTGKYLYIQAPRRELYDQAADPKADHDLASSSAPVADTLASQMEAFRQKTTRQREAPQAALDPAAQEKLGALGYMASGRGISTGSAADQGADQAADPKDKIEIANMLHRAEILQQDMRSDESIALLEQVIAKEPGLPLYGKLGDWLIRKRDYQKAVPVLRKAMQMDPDSPMTHFQLAKGLMAAGDFAAAVPELEFAVAKVPGFADAHIFLETAYARTNRVPETIRECKTVLEFSPDHFPSYLILGRFLEISGDFEGAVPKLKKAAALEPKAPEPHLFLADAYDQLGLKVAAAHERAIAKRLGASGAE